jgi:hypothetical protein
VTAGSSPWPAQFVSGGGNIGVWFIGPSFGSPNDAQFDNFGGGSLQ